MAVSEPKVCFVAMGLYLASAYWRVRGLAKFCRSSTQGRRHTPGRVLKLFEFKSVGDQVCLKPLVSGMQIEVGLEEARPMEKEELVSCAARVSLETPDKRVVEITSFNPEGNMCWARVLSGGPFERKTAALKVAKRWAWLLTVIFCVLAVGIKHSSIVVEVVQFVIDAMYLS